MYNQFHLQELQSTFRQGATNRHHHNDGELIGKQRKRE